MQYIRIYEVHGGKVYKELPLDHSLTTMTDYLTLYAEVIPEEEREAKDGDTAIYCFHFDKEPNKPHGVPFRFVVQPVSRVWILASWSELTKHRGSSSRTLKRDYQNE